MVEVECRVDVGGAGQSLVLLRLSGVPTLDCGPMQRRAVPLEGA